MLVEISHRPRHANGQAFQRAYASSHLLAQMFAHCRASVTPQNSPLKDQTHGKINMKRAKAIGAAITTRERSALVALHPPRVNATSAKTTTDTVHAPISDDPDTIPPSVMILARAEAIKPPIRNLTTNHAGVVGMAGFMPTGGGLTPVMRFLDMTASLKSQSCGVIRVGANVTTLRLAVSFRPCRACPCCRRSFRFLFQMVLENHSSLRLVTARVRNGGERRIGNTCNFTASTQTLNDIGKPLANPGQ